MHISEFSSLRRRSQRRSEWWNRAFILEYEVIFGRPSDRFVMDDLFRIWTLITGFVLTSFKKSTHRCKPFLQLFMQPLFGFIIRKGSINGILVYF